VTEKAASAPRASLVLPDGTKLTIEGTPDQVAALVGQIAGGQTGTAGVDQARKRRSGGPSNARTKGSRKGPVDHIRELVADDFFKTKRGLGDVQKKLEEGAHIYPITSLSPALFRLVRLKELRRIKEGGVWKYVNP
jgi:hypothetical protein